MRIRPHHILCLTFFRGEGYSDAFCENMSGIKRKLDTNTLIELARGVDDVCQSCPNAETLCPGAALYDERVLMLCDLHYTQKLTWAQATELAEQNILRKRKLSAVCGDCQWAVLCESMSIVYCDSKAGSKYD